MGNILKGEDEKGKHLKGENERETFKGKCLKERNESEIFKGKY